MLYDYFKQLFAQVTNPPIDSIREEVIMSLECYIGPEGNLLETTEQHAHRLLRAAPDPHERGAGRAQAPEPPRLADARRSTSPGPRAKARRAWSSALDRICREAEQAIDDGYSLVVLSDRGVSADRVPVSSLLAVRRRASSPRSARPSGRGSASCSKRAKPARCITTACWSATAPTRSIPYLAFEALWQAQRDGLLPAEYSDDEDRRTPITRRSPRACSR